MRIGIDCRLWDETGVGRYIRNLVKELAAIDEKNEYVLFVLSKDSEKIKKYLVNYSSFTYKLVLADIRWHSVKEQLVLPKIINQEQVDVMHFPYHSVPLFYTKPFVVTIHDLIPYHYPTGKASRLPEVLYEFKNQVYRIVVHSAANRAKQVIVPSEATKQDVSKTLNVSREHVSVTHEGVDELLQKGQDVSESLKKFATDRKYFLYVGNTYPHKNVERMINAFIKLSETEKNVSLLLVGREDYFYQRIKKAVKKHQQIFFMHEVSDSELHYLYTHSLATLVPSLLEGFGLTALEAMSNECIVIASDIPVLREVCGEAALYFDKFSENELRGRMLEVYNLTSEEKSKYLSFEKSV